ncbi:DUF6316 family protein [Aliikangiella sp. G2MR2-5]|uniref:DUF6316 family protein n=1 Tax=Aliikangiella sp. G2MR2-5 TaxID=2788943 RepID=UPI0018AB6D87|nr:DUF6316 family protein [Aliikangiella sp. G2MR2-5]
MRKEDRSSIADKNDFERSDRLYQTNDGWFFTIRQGASFGPYQTRQHAEQNLQSFVELVAK